MSKMKKLKNIIVLSLLSMLFISLYYEIKNEENPPKTNDIITEEAKRTTNTLEKNRCIDIDKDFLKRIEYGTNTTGLTISNAKAVKSNEFNPDVFFVSAEMDGPGLEGLGGVAVFAVFNLSNSMIMSVNATANEFFDWADGRKSKLELSIVDDGVRESMKCLE
jgi:hypothetical protein